MLDDFMECDTCNGEFTVVAAAKNSDETVKYCPFCGSEIVTEYDDVSNENDEED
jgi:rRNA maturation endonuclease Nob1